MINLKKVINSLFSFIIKYCGKSLRNRQYLLKGLCCAVERYSNDFISYNCRPKSVDDLVVNKSVEEKIEARCAIILQGPILEEADFTIETVKLYKNMYSDHCIIVSTWNNTDKKTIKRLEDLNIEVVLNEAPETSGLGNVNYQRVSTLGGIKRARELKCDYILKTRTDQRISMPNFLSYFFSLLDLYPVDKNKSNMKKRLIIVSGIVGGIMFIPYMLSDFLYFGTINDVSDVFSMKNDSLNMSREERSIFINNMFNKTSIYNFYEKSAPESRIVKEFIENYTNIEADGSVKSYWEFVKSCAITLSIRDIDLYWRKYNIYEESEITKIYPRGDSKDDNYRYIWNFANWIMLYSGRFSYKTEFEEYKENIIKV